MVADVAEIIPVDIERRSAVDLKLRNEDVHLELDMGAGIEVEVVEREGAVGGDEVAAELATSTYGCSRRRRRNG